MVRKPDSDRLSRLLRAVIGVGTDLDVPSTLQHLVESAAGLTDARVGVLGVIDQERGGVRELFAFGADEEAERRVARLSVGDLGPFGDLLDGPGSGPGPGPGPGPASAPEPEPASGSEPGPEPGPGVPREGPSGAGASRSRSTAPTFLRVRVMVGEDLFGNLCLTDRAEGRFTYEDQQVLWVLAAQAGIAIGNARLYGRARQRERWIEGAAAVTTALLAGENAAEALTTVAEQARFLADANAGVILQPTDEGGMEIVTVSTGDDPAGIVGTSIEPGSAVLEQLLGGEAVFLDDSATDPRMTTHVRERFGPSMMLPLQANGRLIGTLALPRRRGARGYTSVERLMATQFASQAALALVLADTQQRRERLAVFEDRDRIARDLHDLVVQRLFATGMMLESTRRRAEAEPGVRREEAGDGAGTGDPAGAGGATPVTGAHVPGSPVPAILERAIVELESTIQEVRTAIFALQQPPTDAPATLRGKVLREAAGAAAVLGFQPSVHFGGAVDSRIDATTGEHLLTALRRALAAASRRTSVSRVDIAVDSSAALPDGREAVRLTVYDNGATEEAEGTEEMEGTEEAEGTEEMEGTEERQGEEGAREGNPGTTLTWQSPL
ncbi:sensor histidine kinase [Streptomyces tsukubensis]|uniref:GAF domain-containing protein n=1 Tax=Streptomyces tsukubensis TaxID=83656 RepID=A0A1V4A6J3_9ACTN|nr:GAF domain-containing protein [Streptomyces tsukubensis]OON76641.1 hypothetical protein B1H18_20110 [Streptomyces tsukubensis]QFR93395.1 GAF domain-containing protein [Streptomyces tsukubensis]